MKNAVNKEYLEARFRRRLEYLSSLAPGTAGDVLGLQLVSSEPEQDVYYLRGKTDQWMRNCANTLHGGMGATILDHAMGITFYGLKAGDTVSPTVEMQVSYHRPLLPGEDVLVKVRVMAITKTLAHLVAEVYQYDEPERLCLSGTAIYFVTE